MASLTGARNYDASKKSSGPSPLNRRTSTMDNIMATESSDDDSDEEDDQASSRPKALHRAESQLHSFMHLVRHRLGAQDDVRARVCWCPPRPLTPATSTTSPCATWKRTSTVWSVL